MKQLVKDIFEDLIEIVNDLTYYEFDTFVLGLLIVILPLWLPFWVIGKIAGVIANKLDS